MAARVLLSGGSAEAGGVEHHVEYRGRERADITERSGEVFRIRSRGFLRGSRRPLQRQSRWSLPLSAAVRLGHLAEASSIIDVASALNLVDTVDVDFFQDKFLQIVKMLYKLR